MAVFGVLHTGAEGREQIQIEIEERERVVEFWGAVFGVLHTGAEGREQIQTEIEEREREEFVLLFFRTLYGGAGGEFRIVN